MRTRTLAASVVMLLSAERVAAQSVQIYADSACSACDVHVPYPGGVVFYTVLHPGPSGGASFVAFRILGLPPGWTTITQRVHATAFDWLEGDLFGDGVRYRFPCRSGDCIPLFRTLVLPNAAASDITLSVTHSPFDCGRPFPWDCRPPVMGLCDETLVALAESAAGTINGNADCTVGVRAITWSQVRMRYR